MKAVIFDYGGVIVRDTDPVVFKHIADKFNIPYDDAVKAINKFLWEYQKGELTDKEFWDSFSYEIEKELPEGYENLWNTEYLVNSRRNILVINLIKELKKNYHIALLSNTIPPHARANRDAGNFSDFEKIVLSCEVGSRKPETRIYALTADSLGLSVEECIFIDDKQEYVDAAKKVGMVGIKFENFNQLLSELKNLGISTTN